MSRLATSAILLTVHICFVLILSGCKANLASVDKVKYPTAVPDAIKELSGTINKLSAKEASEFVSPEEVAQKGGTEEIDLEERLNKEIQELIAETMNEARERASLPDKLHSLNH